MNEPVITQDLRVQLKAILAEELKKLPETLNEMEPKDRINILCKLMPFIIPKVNSIHHSTGEPFTTDW